MEKITLADGGVTLYQGDCLELLAAGALPRDAAVITDPPYGIGFRIGKNGKGLNPSSSLNGPVDSHRDPIHNDDRPFYPAPWLGFTKVALCGANHYATRLPDDSGAWLCWDKSCGTGPADAFVDAEFIWCSVRASRCIHRQLWKGVCREGEEAPSRASRLHVSQKPVELMRWLIETARVRVDTVVLDPYMGSGSTGVAALRSGRRFIGIEIDPGHFATAVQRIEREWAALA